MHQVFFHSLWRERFLSAVKFREQLFFSYWVNNEIQFAFADILTIVTLL